MSQEYLNLLDQESNLRIPELRQRYPNITKLLVKKIGPLKDKLMEWSRNNLEDIRKGEANDGIYTMLLWSMLNPERAETVCHGIHYFAALEQHINAGGDPEALWEKIKPEQSRGKNSAAFSDAMSEFLLESELRNGAVVVAGRDFEFTPRKGMNKGKDADFLIKVPSSGKQFLLDVYNPKGMWNDPPLNEVFAGIAEHGLERLRSFVVAKTRSKYQSKFSKAYEEGHLSPKKGAIAISGISGGTGFALDALLFTQFWKEKLLSDDDWKDMPGLGFVFSYLPQVKDGKVIVSVVHFEVAT